MSSYFDNAAREVAENFDRIKDVEARVINDVNLVTGDQGGKRKSKTGNVATVQRDISPS